MVFFMCCLKTEHKSREFSHENEHTDGLIGLGLVHWPQTWYSVTLEGCFAFYLSLRSLYSSKNGP